MSYEPVSEEGRYEHSGHNDQPIDEDDHFMLSDGHDLPRIQRSSFSKSFPKKFTRPLRDAESDHDGRYDSDRGVQFHAQSEDQQRSIPRKPTTYYESRPKPEVMFDGFTAGPPETCRTFTNQPRPLEPYTSKKLLGLLAELLVCLAPIAFLILAVLAKGLDGHEISGYGENVKEWTLLSPTIFPLVFAAVVGRSLHNVVRYRLERGCTLKLVEQFVGSQSVFGAVFTQIRLHLVDVSGVTLILLWLVSPLGGQASLRLLSTQKSTVITKSQIGFANLTGSSSQLFDDLQSRLYETTFNGLYTASLVSPLEVKQGPQDSWGNLKIPTFESLTTQPDETGLKVVPIDEDVDWASLLGLPVTGLKEEAQVNSTISTQYYYINCSRLYGVDGTSDWPAKLGITGHDNTNIWMYWTASYDLISQWLVFFNGNYHNSSWPESPKVNMLFTSWSGNSIGGDAGVFYTANATIANCTIEPSFVDLQVVCNGFACRAAAARRSSRVRPTNSSDYESNLAWWGTLFQQDSEAVRDFISYWTLANASPDTGQISPTLMYIGGSEAFPFVTSAGDIGGEPPTLYDLKLEDFTRRMRRLFNTYWQTSIGPPAYNATIPKGDAAAFLSGKTGNDSSELDQMSLSPADATFEHEITIYRTDTWWLVITIIASLILLLTGFIGFAAKCACVGPDLLGSFTTALRVGPQTAPFLEGNNSTLDSGNLTKANKSLIVTLQDVRPGQDVGLVTIGVDSSAKGIAEVWRRNAKRLFE